jgi:hypothetical protein
LTGPTPAAATAHARHHNASFDYERRGSSSCDRRRAGGGDGTGLVGGFRKERAISRALRAVLQGIDVCTAQRLSHANVSVRHCWDSMPGARRWGLGERRGAPNFYFPNARRTPSLTGITLTCYADSHLSCAAARPAPPVAHSAPSTWSSSLRPRPGPRFGSMAVLGFPLDDDELNLLNFTRPQDSSAHLVYVPLRIMQAAIGRIYLGLGAKRVPRSVNEAQR